MIYKKNEYKELKNSIVVVIDVLRAFTTSSFLFANDIKKIYLIEDLYYAKQHKGKMTLIGEKGGRQIKGFDFDNSSSQIHNTRCPDECPDTCFKECNIDKKITDLCILRTGNGVKGCFAVAKNKNVKEILCGSLTTAYALKKYLKGKDFDCLITGSATPDGGTEDISLANFLYCDLTMEQAVEKVINSYSAKNWIKRKQDVLDAVDETFDFIQRITEVKEKHLTLEAFNV